MDVLTVYTNKEGKKYLKPKLDSYGVKAIKILAHDGTVFELNEKSVIQLNEKTITTKNGKMDIMEGWSNSDMLNGIDTREKTAQF